MILAGDIGGTKTLLGLFHPAGERPRPTHTHEYSTLEYGDLTDIIAAFLKDERMSGASVSEACFGVAGPVIDDAAELTNVPRRGDGRKVASSLGGRPVSPLDGLQPMASAVPVVAESEVRWPPPGSRTP